MVSERPMKTIRIQVGKDMEQVLKALKGRYPLLDNVEIIKLSLSDFYYEGQKPHAYSPQEMRHALEQLPELALSDEEREELTKAIDEAKKDEGIILTPHEAALHILSLVKRA